MPQEMIDNSMLRFLRELKGNNNRDWFNANKSRYQDAQATMKSLARAVYDKLSRFDQLEEPKVFRIYRDVRFSKNKTPYKTNLSCGIGRATNLRRGGMYLSIEPGASFVGGGFWGPNSEDIKRIRTELAADPASLRKIISEKAFVDTFGTLQGDQVKTAPRGYTKDHPAIDLLRYKQYLLMREFSDKEVLASDFADRVVETLRGMYPFFDYMTDVLTTDENGAPIV